MYPPLASYPASQLCVQYASGNYQEILREHGITCSMSRRGDCWDNAVAESYFASVEWELIQDSDWHTREEAERGLFEYLEVWYNRQRRHSALGYRTPAEYEAQLALTRRAGCFPLGQARITRVPMTHGSITFRSATREDVEPVVAMLADDALGRQRERHEKPLPRSYYEAFEAIDRDPNNELMVACQGEVVVGVLQITFTPYLTYQGSWRATIEGVRTASTARGRGIGRDLLQRAIVRARERGCHLVQLTTDKRRNDARRFYERLGFEATHEGMKLHLHSRGQDGIP